MKSKPIAYLVVITGLAALVWANLSNPVAWANDREASFNGQTVPTRTPSGQKPTPKPTNKPPKEPTDTPMPSPSSVSATPTSTLRAAATSTATSAPTSLPTVSATPTAAAALATIAPLATETATREPTSAPITVDSLATASAGANTSTGPQATPLVDSGGNSPSPVVWILTGVALVIIGVVFFGRSRSNSGDKPH